MKRRPHSPAGQAAFTLPELLFTMAISSLIMGGLMTSYIFSVRAFRGLSHYNEMAADGRWALEWLGRDVRVASAVAAWTPAEVVLVLPQAVNADGSISATHTVSHALQAGAWVRNPSAGSARTLASQVNSLAFTLYDQAGNITTQLSEAVSVQAEAVLQHSLGSMTQSSEVLSARYRMRNTP